MRYISHRRPATGSPRVVAHFPSLHKRHDIDENVHMFTQDVQLSIMPIGGKSSRIPEFSVEIQGSLDHIEYVTAILESLAEHDRYSLEELLCDAVDQIAQRLAWRGVAVHEIIRDEENDGTYLLHDFTSERLFHVLGRYIQLIPKNDRDLCKKAYVIVPESDIWEISIPRILGGRQGYRAILKGLARFQHFGPSFWRNDLSNQDRPAYFDFQRYVREVEIFYSKITVRWGWGRRDYSQKNWTEFYQLYRSIRFKWAQASMREHIVSEMNALIRRLGIEAEIVVKGLPTATEITTIQQRMLEGDISLSDAYGACSV